VVSINCAARPELTLDTSGASDAATHKIYIWDVANDGRYLTTLDGGREPLVDVHVRTLTLLALLANRHDYFAVASIKAAHCVHNPTRERARLARPRARAMGCFRRRL
jgi:hypothetical protein